MELRLPARPARHRSTHRRASSSSTTSRRPARTTSVARLRGTVSETQTDTSRESRRRRMGSASTRPRRTSSPTADQGRIVQPSPAVTTRTSRSVALTSATTRCGSPASISDASIRCLIVLGALGKTRGWAATSPKGQRGLRPGRSAGEDDVELLEQQGRDRRATAGGRIDHDREVHAAAGDERQQLGARALDDLQPDPVIRCEPPQQRHGDQLAGTARDADDDAAAGMLRLVANGLPGILGLLEQRGGVPVQDLARGREPDAVPAAVEHPARQAPPRGSRPAGSAPVARCAGTSPRGSCSRHRRCGRSTAAASDPCRTTLRRRARCS